MGFLRRLLGGGEQQPDRHSGHSPQQRPGWTRDGMEVQLYEGREDLEVVGEASYQDSLWRVVGDRSSPNDRVRMEAYAVLVVETDNPTTLTPCRCGSRGSRSAACPATMLDDTGPACSPWSRSTASRSPLPAPLWGVGCERTARVGSASSWTTTLRTSAFA
jgi:hypothetical protein